MNSPTSTPVALITGSTKGIGRAIAFALAAKGHRVVITSRQQSHAEEVAATLNSAGQNALGLGFDLEDVSQLDTLIRAAIAHYGRLDILVNNAISQRCLFPSSDYGDEQVSTTITGNLTHTYLLCQKAFPHLKAQRGNILNIGSAVTRRHLLGLPLYSLVKRGLLATTQILAAEWASAGVRVNAINPGFVRTQAFSDMGMDAESVAASYDFYDQYQPLGGTGDVKDIAQAASFLTSEDAGFITGAIIDADGGYSNQGLALYS